MPRKKTGSTTAARSDGAAARKPAAPASTSESETTRFTIDIPVELHARIKAYCALHRVSMRDEILPLLDRHFLLE